MITRRLMLKGAAATIAVAALPFNLINAAAAATPKTKKGKTMLTYPYSLPELPYAASALAPVIDEETMATHHGKHHQAYITKLNDALKETPEFQKLSLAELMQSLDKLPDSIKAVVRNNGGGHVNHSMFWQIMAAPGSTQPGGKLAEAIDRDFGSMDEFKKQFNSAGEKQFGSGWAFVTADKSGKLAVVAMPNQDTPLSKGQVVLFGNDVWEHAYYITYRNRRPEYLQAWWQVLNWDKVEERYQAAMRGEVFI